MSAILSPENPMLLFGCGNMGRAMLDGWLRAGLGPACFSVVDPNVQNLPAGVAHYTSLTETDGRFALSVLAIKPQMLHEAASDFAQLLLPDAIVLSLLAGTTVQSLQGKLPGRHIVRVMPNLAAAIGKSPIGMFSDNLSGQEAINRLMKPLGSTHWMASEGLMDVVTALAGSGPAFVYRFIDALAKGGTELGLNHDQSLQLALSMVQGAAELAALNNIDPAELARRVTSPGGTTAAGLAILDADDVLQKLVSATLTAARDRGVELSKGQ